MILQIVGGILVLASIIGGTILLSKKMEIRYKEEKERRELIAHERQNLTAENYRLLYEEERQRREDAEFRASIKDRELKRARELMKTVNLMDITDKKDGGIKK